MPRSSELPSPASNDARVALEHGVSPRSATKLMSEVVESVLSDAPWTRWRRQAASCDQPISSTQRPARSEPGVTEPGAVVDGTSVQEWRADEQPPPSPYGLYWAKYPLHWPPELPFGRARPDTAAEPVPPPVSAFSLKARMSKYQYADNTATPLPDNWPETTSPLCV